MSSLRLDWCSHAAAKYAVEHWHYSRTMPIGPMVKMGVWEGEEFRGSVLFARGNTPTLGGPYGLGITQVCELVRIALRCHDAPVSQLIAIGLRLLRKHCPALRLVVSFADPSQGHHGGIYQAGGWVYTGMSSPDKMYWHNGEWKHSREVRGGAFGRRRKIIDGGRSLQTRTAPGKHRYLYPFDAEMKARIAPLAKPYPKRPCARGVDSGTAGFHPAGGGADPTRALAG